MSSKGIRPNSKLTLSLVAGIVWIVRTLWYVTGPEFSVVTSRAHSDAFPACCRASRPLRPLRSATVDIEVHTSAMEEGIAQANVVRRQENLTVIKSVRGCQLLAVFLFILVVTHCEQEFVIIDIEWNCHIRINWTSIASVSRLWVKKERKRITTNMVVGNSSSIVSLNSQLHT